MTVPTITDLTEATLDGTGIFDELMRATKAHLQEEYNKGRIKGPEYSTVYLGAIQSVMDRALQFLLQKDQVAAQTALLIEQANTERKQQDLVTKQIDATAADIALKQAQTAQVEAETLNVPKQGALIEAQTAQVVSETALSAKRLLQADEEILLAKQQVLLAQEEIKLATAKLANIPAEGELLRVQALQVTQQTENLAAEALNIPKQGTLLDAQADQVTAETALTTQKTTNAETENTVLVAQECKLRAEYDVLMEQKLKAVNETALLAQKKVTEAAQTTAMGVDEDSVIGKQKALYTAQTGGYQRDAEQKAAKLLVDSWNVRRTTDEGTTANTTNQLDDATVGRAISKLLTGVGA